jgi:hypothetical protein
MKMVAFWVVALIMEAARTYVRSVKFYESKQCNNPEDSHLKMLQICKLQITISVLTYI